MNQWQLFLLPQNLSAAADARMKTVIKAIELEWNSIIRESVATFLLATELVRRGGCTYENLIKRVDLE